MQIRSFGSKMLVVASSLSLIACSSNTASNEAPDSSASSAATATAAASFPPSLRVIGDGYPASGDPCRRLGESAATVDWLDDSAVLVGCPTKEAGRALGGRMVGVIDGITLVSVPMGDANAGMPSAAAMQPPVKVAPAKDLVRGRGGLEDKCKAAVNKQTGGAVVGTNRIEESEAAIAVYVNVQGAGAPWRCLGYKDGTLGEVMYTGSEGDL